MKPNRMYVTELTCDVCGVKLCQDGKGLDSYAYFCSHEHYVHFCKDHTKSLNSYIDMLIQNYPLLPSMNIKTT